MSEATNYVKLITALVENFVEQEFGIDFPVDSSAIVDLAEGIYKLVTTPESVVITAEKVAGRPLVEVFAEEDG